VLVTNHSRPAEQATLQAEEGHFMPLVRRRFAFPFVLFNFKVIVWDRMLHWVRPIRSRLT
jgi:hypothetical protein